MTCLQVSAEIKAGCSMFVQFTVVLVPAGKGLREKRKDKQADEDNRQPVFI